MQMNVPNDFCPPAGLALCNLGPRRLLPCQDPNGRTRYVNHEIFAKSHSSGAHNSANHFLPPRRPGYCWFYLPFRTPAPWQYVHTCERHTIVLHLSTCGNDHECVCSISSDRRLLTDLFTFNKILEKRY